MQKMISETKDLWTYLQSSTKPIVLYGMGNGAEKIIEIFSSYNIEISGIFASDEFVRGNSFAGFKIEKYSEICERLQHFIIVVCFGTSIPEVMERIYSYSAMHELYAPDIPVYGNGLFTYEYFLSNINALNSTYTLLFDAKSKQVFLDLINYKISGKLCYLKKTNTPIAESYKLLKLTASEVFADLGAYKGDTIDEFLHFSNGNYKAIIAFEPDIKNFGKLQIMVENHALQNVYCHNIATSDKYSIEGFSQSGGRNSSLKKTSTKDIICDAADNYLTDFIPTYINIDVEGAEEKTLYGLSNTIKLHSPKIILSLYHRISDFYALPLILQKINPNYNFYLRHFPYIPAWETCLIAIPK